MKRANLLLHIFESGLKGDWPGYNQTDIAPFTLWVMRCVSLYWSSFLLTHLRGEKSCPGGGCQTSSALLLWHHYLMCSRKAGIDQLYQRGNTIWLADVETTCSPFSVAACGNWQRNLMSSRRTAVKMLVDWLWGCSSFVGFLSNLAKFK